MRELITEIHEIYISVSWLLENWKSFGLVTQQKGDAKNWINDEKMQLHSQSSYLGYLGPTT